MKQDNSSNKPFSQKHGRLQISVFENTNKDCEVYFSTYILRRFKNGDDQWKDGPLSERDLEDLDSAKQIATKYIAKRKEESEAGQLDES